MAPFAPDSPHALMPSALVVQTNPVSLKTIAAGMCSGQSVVEQRAAQQLTRGRIVDGTFQERLADALCNTALNLPLDICHVQDAAKVVDCDVG